MSSFPWPDSPTTLRPGEKDIETLAKEIGNFKESVNDSHTSIEGIITNLLKLYQAQFTDNANFRREVLSYIKTTRQQTETSEEIFGRNGLSYPDDEDIENSFVFNRPPGQAPYYKEVILKALEGTNIRVSFNVRLDDLFSAVPGKSEYMTYLRGRYVDYLIYDEVKIYCAVVLPHSMPMYFSNQAADFIKRLCSAFEIKLFEMPTLEELKEFLKSAE
jgi:hypothetical protein